MKVLGLYGASNQWTHDHSLSVSEDGVVTDYVQLERVTRRKYDNQLPRHLPSLLEGLNFDPGEDELVYVNTFSLGKGFFKHSDDSLIDTDGEIVFKAPGNSSPEVRRVEGSFMGTRKQATVIPHELAHVFSCVPFYGMFRDNSLLIHIDGAASISNASAWYYSRGRIKLLEFTSELHPILKNFDYNDLTLRVLNLSKERYLSAPGKLMGLSSFGRVDHRMLEWLEKHRFFRNIRGDREREVIQGANSLGYELDRIVLKHAFSYNYAATIQHLFTSKLTEFIEKHRLITGADYLYFAGGAALSIKLNSHLIRSGKFKEIFVPPPAGDSGLSLGAVSYYNWENKITGKRMGVYMNNYRLNEWRFDPDFSVDEVCRDLYRGKVIGVCTGYGEVGPRALGHRSILAIPHKKMFRKVSMEIKGREWYRPIAPILLEENLEVMFHEPTPTQLMYYMLQEMEVERKVRDKVPAIVHVDGTARPQVVPSRVPELDLVREILQTMYERYDYPCLINTSFNSAGEPIVHTHEDAMKSARRMGLDAVILDNNYMQVR